MDAETYLDLKKKIINDGYAPEVDWCEDIEICTDSKTFALETIFVIINSGMKNQIAQKIYEKVLKAIGDGQDVSVVFGHKGKVEAIKYIQLNYERLYSGFRVAKDRIGYLETIPFIGKITKYHLARNLGIDAVKPDRHLVRISKTFNLSSLEMCENISKIVGDRIGVVDVVIWRAANLGYI